MKQALAPLLDGPGRRLDIFPALPPGRRFVSGIPWFDSNGFRGYIFKPENNRIFILRKDS
jgi:hypothetical protein